MPVFPTEWRASWIFFCEKYSAELCVSTLLLILLIPCSGTAQPLGEKQPATRPEAVGTLLSAAQPDPSESKSPARGPEISLLGHQAVLFTENLSPAARQFTENWQALRARHNATAVFGPGTSPMPRPVLAQWKNISARMATMPSDEKLRIINGFFNNWSSETDARNYGQDEYWASPEEFLAKGGGDCEDFAIIKYLALRYFSWPADDLWLIFVDDRINNGKHAVLAARMNNRIFILDNLSRPAYLLIPEKQYAGQVTPLYALNEQGIWLFTGKSDKAKVEPEKNNTAAGSDKKSTRK